MMRIRTMAAAAATITLLAACSRAPETAAPAADAAAATNADVHTDHAATASALPRTPAPAGAAVFIVSPKDGDTVASPVQVVFGISGMALGPALEKNDNAGHHHLLVNTDLADPTVPIPTDEKHVHFGKAQTEGSLELPPGTHTLQLVLGDYLHIPFDPVIASPKISITVR